MKSLLIIPWILLLVWCSHLSKAQSIKPVWGKQMVVNFEEGKYKYGWYNINTDSDGNVYILKDFEDSIKFDKTVFYSDSANSTIIIKLNPSGKKIWVLPWVNKAVAFSSNQVLNVDPSTILISGWYFGNFVLNDSIILDSFESSKLRNIYVVDIDSSSQINWAQSLTDITSLKFRLSSGNEIYFSGETAQSPDSISVFGQYIPKNKTFVGKISKEGKATFVRSFPDEVSGFCVDKDENIYITGTFGWGGNTIKIDTFTLLPSSNEREDIFLAKISKDFKVKWIQQVKSFSEYDYVNSRNIVTDNSGNLYYAFEYSDSFEIGDTVIYGLKNTTKLAIIKFDASGQPVWIKTTQSNMVDFYESVGEITFEKDMIKLRATFHSESLFDGFTFHTVEQQQQSIVTMDTNGTIQNVLNLELVAAQYAKAPGDGYYQYARLSRNPLTFVKGWEFKPVANADMLLIKVDTLIWWVSSNSNLPGKVIIRPNPVSERLWLNVPQKVLSHAEVYDLQGRQMKSLDFNNPVNTSIEVASLPKGMYLLTATDKSGHSYFAKFVKQ